jgi:hypothetical protein
MRLDEMDGMFIGFLSDEEIDIFNAAYDAGKARRSYEGVGGFLGLAMVRLIPAPGDRGKRSTDSEVPNG